MWAVDYSATGAFEKVVKKSKGKHFIVALLHVSGQEATMSPPLEDHYTIEANQNDWLSKLVHDSNNSEIPCWKVFQKAGKLDAVPKFLSDDRVGQSSSSSSSPDSKGKKPVLALANHPHIPEAACNDLAIVGKKRGRGGPSGLPAGAPPTALPRVRR